MTTSSGFTVMFFFTNLRLGFSVVVSGSVTAATTTERRALTALPDLAPKRACAVAVMGLVGGQTRRRVESRRFRGAAFPAADAGGWRRIGTRISTDDVKPRRGASPVAGGLSRAYLDGRGHGGHGGHGGHVYENERRCGRCTRASGNARLVPYAEKRFSSWPPT